MRPTVPAILIAAIIIGALVGCDWLVRRHEKAVMRPPIGTFAAGPRDRLCIDGHGDSPRAAMIVYGNNTDSNCSVAGGFYGEDPNWYLHPDGDQDCRIQFRMSADGLRAQAVEKACSYYCGPGATWKGASFRQISDKPAPVKDLAGDILRC
jgi:hypothetical protein